MHGDCQCWNKFRTKTKRLTKKQLEKAGEKFLETYALDLDGRDIPFVQEMSRVSKPKVLYYMHMHVPRPLTFCCQCVCNCCFLYRHAACVLLAG